MQQHNVAIPQQQITIRFLKNVPTLVDTTEPHPHWPPSGLAASSSRHRPVPGVAPASTSAIISNGHTPGLSMSRQPVHGPASGAISRYIAPAGSSKITWEQSG